jgi:hypothetical protein
MREEAELEVIHILKNKSEVEKVQRRAARYTTGRFHNTSSVTSMLDHLEWNSLETRRNIAKVLYPDPDPKQLNTPVQREITVRQ